VKEILGVGVAMALLIGVSTLAVQQFGDRETFIPPPDAVAEGFVREVVTKRWDRARAYLAEPESMSNARIEALQKSWEERVGDPTKIEAKTIARDDEQALANVQMQSARGSEAVAFALRFENEWKIVHTPSVGYPIH
jgi:hypothetical protein